MHIGEKLKALRLENRLTQAELAARCELSKGFISLVERDLTSPSIATLADLLGALGSDLTEFFQTVEEEKIVYRPDEIFESEHPQMGHKIAWLISNSQKNDMEPILITLQSGGVYTEEDAHEGQEFGYVMAGQVEIILGARSYRVKRGESFYYTAKLKHKIHNPYQRIATLLMVSTPPSF